MVSREVPSFKALFIPLAVEQLFQLLLGQMDVIMLSQYADESVAAIGLANQIIVMVTMVYGFIHFGTMIQLTQISSTENKRRGAEIVSHAMQLNIVFTIILTSVIVIFSESLLQLIQTPDDLMKEATTYLEIIAYGFLFHSLMGLMGAIFRSYSMVKLVMIITVTTNIINIILNYVVLFTPVQLLGEGVFGVALATNLSRVVGALLLLIYFAIHQKRLFSTINWSYVNLHITKKILYLGTPSAGEHVSYNLSQTIITGFIATLGAATVTAKIYTQTITSIVFAISMAISQATQLIIGKLIGIKLHQDAYRFSVRLFMKSISFSMLFTFVIALLSFMIVPFLTDNQEVRHLTIKLIFLSILLEPARTANVMLISALNVAGDVKYPVMISVIIVWGFVIPMSYMLGIWFNYGLLGIWIVFILDEWIRAFLLYSRWKKGKWKTISVIS